VRTSFPDFRGTVEILLAEGDLVAGRVTWRGTQQGPFLGLPPSGTQVEIAAFHIVRLSAGRIVEWWGTADLLGALQQLDARILPPPA
jgi:predicted ester cyclase